MIVAFPMFNGTLNGTHTVQSTVQIPYNGISKANVQNTTGCLVSVERNAAQNTAFGIIILANSQIPLHDISIVFQW